ncbi:MAG: transposase [Bacteroidetes bacterium]|nr:MAG: transposase [Bacteroidota bacterium]
MPIKFRNKYRIASARLSTWDYASNGSYFVTICTAHREHFFGEVVNSQMQFSQIGERANKCWRAIPDHFSYFKLDEFSVMPNHLHGIIIIEKPCGNHRGGFNAVETGHALSLQPNAGESPKNPNHRRFRNQGKKTMSSMVGSFKSAVTKYCNENNLTFGWQSRFHDHIIRNEDEFYAIRNYIINNPRNWKEDKFYSR